MLTNPERPLVYAHRGARDVAPENTLAAFKAAVHAGADGIECDVSRCKTGEIIIIHDDSTRRTTNQAVTIKGSTYATLRRLDAGAWFAPEFTGEKLPVLEELLDMAGHSLLMNIEIKGHSMRDDGIEVEIARQLAVRGQTANTIVSSFNPWALKRMHQADPAIARALLYWAKSPAYLALKSVVKDLPIAALHPEYTLVDREYMNWAHGEGYLVNVWTVNEHNDMCRMIELGVDGIITDHPAYLVSLLAGRN